jgi:hypothetical protein
LLLLLCMHRRGLNYIPAEAGNHHLIQTDRYNAARKRYHAEGALVSYFDKVGHGIGSTACRFHTQIVAVGACAHVGWATCTVVVGWEGPCE